jgi:HSP20 family protein
LLTNVDPTLPMFPVKELKYGRFERTIDVPAGLEVRIITQDAHSARADMILVQVKDISASLADGMLSVSWPRVPPVLSQGPTHVITMA